MTISLKDKEEIMESMRNKKEGKLVWTPVDSVARRGNLSCEEFVREHASVGKPVIVNDVVKNWRAYTKWNLDFFRSKYGSVKLRRMQTYDPQGEAARYERTYETMRVEDYMDNYMAGTASKKVLYLRDLSVYYYPELLDDCGEEPGYFNNWYRKLPLALLKKHFERTKAVFIGFKGTSIGLHYDTGYSASWVAVITGRKKVILFAPDQEKYLYEGRVNCFNPNLEKFPLYAKAKPVECVLDHGEMLFIPTMWWHQIKNLEDTISLTINTINEWNFELLHQEVLESSPVTGHFFPLLFRFPWLGKVLVSAGFI